MSRDRGDLSIGMVFDTSMSEPNVESDSVGVCQSDMAAKGLVPVIGQGQCPQDTVKSSLMALGRL